MTPTELAALNAKCADVLDKYHSKRKSRAQRVCAYARWGVRGYQRRLDAAPKIELTCQSSSVS